MRAVRTHSRAMSETNDQATKLRPALEVSAGTDLSKLINFTLISIADSKERIFLSGADVKDVNISTDPVY